mmetsp:Transcript_70371/g.187432  ORF Transcript_70371/g.187432 Transcript_70371/m.187432 type:complete len:211 (+) Transcript_70371:1344-1976(+)
MSEARALTQDTSQALVMATSVSSAASAAFSMLPPETSGARLPRSTTNRLAYKASASAFTGLVRSWDTISAPRSARRVALGSKWPPRRGLVMRAVRRSHQDRTSSSMGNSPHNAPHSVDMFAMVSRSSTDKLATPSPPNSTAWFSTWSWFRNPHRPMITSLPLQPGGRAPRSSTCATGGTRHHVRPVPQILAASVRTTGVPKQPTPPYMFE